jgi:hydroxyacylglutathione hydrolase
VQIRTVVAPLLGTNCYLLQDEHLRCVVVDPGAGLLEEVVAVVRDAGLRPLGLLATHGHVDHTWSAGLLGELWSVPLHIHRADAYRLEDPFGTLGPLGEQLSQIAAASGMAYRAPSRVKTFEGEGLLDLAPAGEPSFPITTHPAPGHTEGSTVYLVDAPGPTALTGDVLFAGTIGRTDLPGGDTGAMTRSLARLVGLDPATVVLPGHGPSSSMATERRTNPYLRTV